MCPLRVGSEGPYRRRTVPVAVGTTMVLVLRKGREGKGEKEGSKQGSKDK